MSLLLRVQLRPYQVIRPFVFNGMSFEPGAVFDPKKAGCDLAKLDRLVSNRYLDATAIPGETKKAPVIEEKVVPAKVEVVEEVPVTEPEPVIEEPKEPEVQEAPVEEQVEDPVAQEEQPTTTRARRRSY